MSHYRRKILERPQERAKGKTSKGGTINQNAPNTKPIDLLLKNEKGETLKNRKCFSPDDQKEEGTKDREKRTGRI